LARTKYGDEEASEFFSDLTTALFFFGGGIVLILIAAYFQWTLYSDITHRKRKLLSRAIQADTLANAMREIANEPLDSEKTSKHGWCFGFLCASFVSFLAGVAIVGAAF
jgi:hypothetical protein